MSAVCRVITSHTNKLKELPNLPVLFEEIKKMKPTHKAMMKMENNSFLYFKLEINSACYCYLF
jgi:hypothetical protein